jgi:dTMP kinase
MLIAIEGIDGAGKSSIAKYLKEELEKRSYRVALFKEPSNSPWGMKIKSMHLKPEEELELFILDRKYDVVNNIIPALKQKKIVIMDRYYYSTIAYQGALGLDVDEIRKRNEEIAPKPDMVIILDLDPQKAIQRISKRGKLDRFEDINYLKKVREIFLSMKNAIVIDASVDLDKVRQKILNLILDRLAQLT